MSQLTRRQHYVPDFYLTQWTDAKGCITCHDIPKGTTFACDPANALLQNYFYEEDPSQPDNRIENILAVMEGACSATFKKLFAPPDPAAGAADPRKEANALQRRITDEGADNLSRFAAYQYMRVSDATEFVTDREQSLRHTPVGEAQPLSDPLPMIARRRIPSFSHFLAQRDPDARNGYRRWSIDPSTRAAIEVAQGADALRRESATPLNGNSFSDND